MYVLVFRCLLSDVVLNFFIRIFLLFAIYLVLSDSLRMADFDVELTSMGSNFE